MKIILILITSITIYASDVILSNTLGAYYCAQEPNPKTYIKHTVEEPISIYWEDNIYPGFDEADSKLMVANYLDGVHLQTMALNTPDGKVRVYSYANIPQSYIDLFKESNVAKKEAKEKHKAFNEAWGKYKSKEYSKTEFDVISKDWAQVDNKSEALTKQIESARSKLDLVITETTRDQIPQMNYTIKTDEVHFSDLARKVLYSDEVKITDNRTKEVIAYDRRIMQLYSAALIPDFAIGMRYYVPDALCGQEKGGLFERGVFTTLERSTTRWVGLNQILYKKYTK
ncbi:MAG: hypothetical protein Q8S36_09740 [Sulfuricurvum sp.]|nr:hypothetical protein [Sulfuricurvum sp.]